MSEHRIHVVPPRELASEITSQSVLRAGWSVAVVYLGISHVAVIEMWVGRDYAPTVLLPIASLVAMLVALVTLMLRPNWITGLIYLSVGTLATFGYVYGLLLTDPSLNDEGIYLVNRMSIVLLLVGAVSSRLVHGMLWCTAGWLLSYGATSAAQFALGMPMRHGYGPFICLVLYLTITMMFVLIRHRQRRFAPDFAAVELETARMAGQRELEERAVALLHDTVLNDLAVLANAKDTLDSRTRARYLSDIESVTNARLDSPSFANADGEGLRRELATIVSDFRWRGLAVNVSGGEDLAARVAPGVADALLGAVRGCLENVLRHAGSGTADVFLDSSDDNLSVMIVDQGVGFDLAAVPENRLGIRSSLVHRIEQSGGRVRIWSSIGSGTSVVISVPLEAARG